MIPNRINTPLFRIALTLAALWIAGWTIAGFLNLRSVQPFSWRDGYQLERERCGYDVIGSTESGEFGWRARSAVERNACFHEADSTYRAYEAEERSGIIARSAKWAIAPAILMLLLATVGRDLITLFRRFGIAYVDWIRGDPKDPPNPK